MCRGQKGTPAAAATMGTRAPALRASGSITSSGCFALIRSPLPWGQPPDWGTGLWVAATRERQRGRRARQGGTARTALMRSPGGLGGLVAVLLPAPLWGFPLPQPIPQVGRARLCPGDNGTAVQPARRARGRAPCSMELASPPCQAGSVAKPLLLAQLRPPQTCSVNSTHSHSYTAWQRLCSLQTPQHLRNAHISAFGGCSHLCTP